MILLFVWLLIQIFRFRSPSALLIHTHISASSSHNRSDSRLILYLAQSVWHISLSIPTAWCCHHHVSLGMMSSVHHIPTFNTQQVNVWSHLNIFSLLLFVWWTANGTCWTKPHNGLFHKSKQKSRLRENKCTLSLNSLVQNWENFFFFC